MSLKPIIQPRCKVTGKLISLPIMQIETDIRKGLLEYQLNIISTPTSSGKTMLVAAWANLISGRTVYVLVPQVDAAREAERGASEIIHGNAYDVAHITGRGESNAARAKVVYMTEGSFIHRRIANKLQKGDIVCIDEVHVQGALTEALLLMAKELIFKGVKVVLMSATLDIPKYSNHYSKDGISVGVVVLPPSERTFQTEVQIVDDPIKAIAIAAAQGGRCLIGVDGKGAIGEITDELLVHFRQMGIKGIPILPMHGELETEDRVLPFTTKGAMIVIATPIIQSSVTIKGLSHGYFTGTAKRMEMQKGRPTLCSYSLSKAEMLQWDGRVGRTCDGIIFRKASEQRAYEGRCEMPIAEILRADLSETILMFNNIGINIRTADLLNKPSKENIDVSYSSLEKQGLVDDKGMNTQLGQKVFELGVGIRGGLITILGEQFGIANTAQKIAAIISRDGFVRNARYSHKNIKPIIEGFEYSDHMSWVVIVDYFCHKYDYRVAPARFEEFKLETEETGMFRRSLVGIMKQFERIDAYDVKNRRMYCEDFVTSYADVKEAIIRIMKAAYVDSTFIEAGSSWKATDGTYLDQSSSSPASLKNAKSVCGDINSFESKRGRMMNFMEGITILEVHVPIETDNAPRFDDDKDAVLIETVTTINSSVTDRTKRVALPTAENTAILLAGLYAKGTYDGCSTWNKLNKSNKSLVEKLQELNVRAGGAFETYSKETIISYYAAVLGAVDYISLEEVKKDFSLELFQISFESISPVEYDTIEGMTLDIERNFPATILGGLEVEYSLEKIVVLVNIETSKETISRIPSTLTWGGITRNVEIKFNGNLYSKENCFDAIVARKEAIEVETFEREVRNYNGNGKSYDCEYVSCPLKEVTAVALPSGKEVYFGLEASGGDTFYTRLYKTIQAAIDVTEVALPIWIERSAKFAVAIAEKEAKEAIEKVARLEREAAEKIAREFDEAIAAYDGGWHNTTFDSDNKDCPLQGVEIIEINGVSLFKGMYHYSNEYFKTHIYKTMDEALQYTTPAVAKFNAMPRVVARLEQRLQDETARVERETIELAARLARIASEEKHALKEQLLSANKAEIVERDYSYFKDVFIPFNDNPSLDITTHAGVGWELFSCHSISVVGEYEDRETCREFVAKGGWIVCVYETLAEAQAAIENSTQILAAINAGWELESFYQYDSNNDYARLLVDGEVFDGETSYDVVVVSKYAYTQNRRRESNGIQYLLFIDPAAGHTIQNFSSLDSMNVETIKEGDLLTNEFLNVKGEYTDPVAAWAYEYRRNQTSTIQSCMQRFENAMRSLDIATAKERLAELKVALAIVMNGYNSAGTGKAATDKKKNKTENNNGNPFSVLKGKF